VTSQVALKHISIYSLPILSDMGQELWADVVPLDLGVDQSLLVNSIDRVRIPFRFHYHLVGTELPWVYCRVWREGAL
jgi:hypothetical protein